MDAEEEEGTKDNDSGFQEREQKIPHFNMKKFI